MPTEPTPQQYLRMTRLREEVPRYNLTHLECPDCGDRLVLKVSRYGRFYGCRTWGETGCRGSISARRDGRPCGIPINQEGRNGRARVLRALELLHETCDVPGAKVINELCKVLGRDPAVFSIGTMDLKECEQILRFLENYGASRSVWSIIDADDDFNLNSAEREMPDVMRME